MRHLERLDALRRSLLVVQFGGAAGTLEKLGDKGPAVRAALADRLGLADAPQWHSQRDRIAELAGWLSLVTGSLGKFGQDVALMAQAGDEIELAGGGGSSAMPHKQNPVDAEVLVTLARFNAAQLSGMHQALVHEQERSGAAWTLEWLILPQMVMATAARRCGTRRRRLVRHRSTAGSAGRELMRTQVAIIGAGPSGLLLGQLLAGTGDRQRHPRAREPRACARPHPRRRARAGHGRAARRGRLRRRGCTPRGCRMTASSSPSTAACTASTSPG